MKGWPRPEMQHDIAEFLQYLVGQCPSLAEKLGVVWASIDATTGEHVDGGCFVPLYLQPPARVFEGEVDAVRVQQMLDRWHRQDRVHAALQFPPSFVLHMGRFEFDTHSGTSLKRGYRMHLDRVIELPLLDNAGGIMRVSVDLCAVAYHLGDTPVSGHYKALVLHRNEFYVADDWLQAQRCRDRDLEECICNAYLFFYVRAPTR